MAFNNNTLQGKTPPFNLSQSTEIDFVSNASFFTREKNLKAKYSKHLRLYENIF